MRILLTGGSGMVGKNLLAHISSSEYELLAPSSSELNLLDKNAVAKYMQLHKPDLVIHGAGRVGGIQANMADPVRFLMENTQMGFHVIHEANQAGVRYCINLASSCIYPRNSTTPITEDQILKGELEPTNEGYALSKISTLRLCQYISQYDAGRHYITLIPCNLYGRYDKFDPTESHMIPAVIRKIHKACESKAPVVEIWGDGEARREFMYVADLADCVFFLIDKIRAGERVPDLTNVGIGRDHSVIDYYRAVAAVIGFKGKFVHDLSKPVGMRQKLIDSTKINQLGWQPQTALIAGIERTYQYFLEYVVDA